MPEGGQLIRTDRRLVRSPSGEPPIIQFDEIMHMGRGEEIRDYKARETPGAFETATFAVQVFHPSKGGDYISRNHLLMYPPGSEGGFSDGFGILDLNSLNGTRLNGETLTPGELVRINHDDCIALTERKDSVQFRFENVPDSASDNHALLVGYPGLNLRGVSGDVRDLKGELDKRGFADNMSVLLKKHATAKNILAILEHIRLKVTSNSTFIFHFSGHGSGEGQICVRPDWREGHLLEAEKVYNILEQFRGKVLLILDGCYTDMFVVPNMPGNVSVVGHAGKAYEGRTVYMPGDGDETSQSSPTKIPWGYLTGAIVRALRGDSPNPTKIIRGYLTRAIVKALRSDPHRVRIPDLVDIVRRDPKIQARQRVVHRPGRGRSTVAIQSQRL